MTSVPSIAFEYRPSWRLSLALAALTVLAVGAAFASALGWEYACLLSCAILACTARACRRQRRIRGMQVRWDSAGQWHVRDRDGHEQVARRVGGTPGAWLVLNLRTDQGHRYAFILTADNLPAMTRRHLCMRLSADPDTH